MKLKNYLKKKPKRIIAIVFILWIVFLGIYHTNKPVPKGLNASSPAYEYNDEQINFIYDLSYTDSNGEQRYEQEIFDTILKRIANAEKYILVDMFLFNSWLGKATKPYRKLSKELTDALIAQKKKHTKIKIDLITDPINTVYGGDTSFELERLKNSNINVIVTNLRPLRDSNFIYSTLWRLGPQWLGNSTWTRWIKHPFSKTQDKVSLRSYLSLLNFKANHRKIFMSDWDDEYTSIIMSANPHDSSSAHSNVAVEITGGKLWQALYTSEAAASAFSGGKLQSTESLQGRNVISSSTIFTKLITEEAIKKELLDNIQITNKGDTIKIATFYLSNRDIINALIDASNRDVEINIILDPNKDAFGYEKNGIPNRQVAHELRKKTSGKIKIRWYATNGEQFHSKLTAINSDNKNVVILGSANLTRRNIDNYNLETNVAIYADANMNFIIRVNEYFSQIWNNNNENVYTIDYDEYADTSLYKYLIYRLQEALGLSSF